MIVMTDACNQRSSNSTSHYMNCCIQKCSKINTHGNSGNELKTLYNTVDRTKKYIYPACITRKVASFGCSVGLHHGAVNSYWCIFDSGYEFETPMPAISF